MKTEWQVRQGDVLLVRVDAVPDAAKVCAPEAGRVVLAHGEVTGHHHSFAADAGVTLLETREGERFVHLERDATLEHQEHAPIQVPAGSYRIIRQREYTPEAIRKIAD